MIVAQGWQRWLPVGSRFVLGILGLAALLIGSPVRADVQYAYDPAGRLVQVVAADSSSAVYQYDAAGNITAIQRLAAGQLAVVTTSSTAGAAGTNITIQGSGFSTNCNNDVVTFNGVAATVVSCTPNQLVVQVPSGASTGPISVTVAGQTVATSQAFSVPPAPVISSFSPAIVNAGGTVTITGSNLAPAAAATRVAVGGTGVRTTSISTTQVAFTASGSGAITVTTSQGQATSATELITVPTSIGASNVLSSATVNQNGPSQNITVAQSGKYGALVFDGTIGQFLSVQITALTTAPTGSSVSYQIISPSATPIASGSVSTTSPTIHLPQLTASGTYAVIFGSGSLTSMALTAGLEVNSVLNVGTAPLSVAASAPAQSKRFVFTATAGQNVALTLTNMGLTPSTPATYIYPYVYKPDGSMLTDPNCYTTNPGGGCNVTMYNLPQTGIYTVRIDSPPQQKTSFNVSIVQAVNGTLTLNTPLAMSLPTSGQFAVISFTLPTTQPVAFQFSSVSTNPAGQYVNAALLNSSNSQVTSLNLNGGSQTTNIPSLAAGTYTIVVTPSYAATASFQLTMGSGISGTLPTDGTSTSISTTVPGQSAYYSFPGTAGQNITLVLSNMSLTPSTPATYIYPYVYKPDGSMLTDPNCYTTNPGASCNVPMYNLPQTGTYTVRFDSPPQQKMSFNVSIVQAVSGTLTLNTPLTMSLPTSGQFAVISFTLPTTQPVAFQFSSVSTNPASQYVNAALLNSSNSQVTSLNLNGGSQTTNLPSLAAGTYTIVVTPSYAATASFQLTMGSGISGTLPTDGTSTSISTTVPGQSAYYSFPGTTGQNITLVLSNMALTPSTPATYIYPYVYKPDGSMLTDPNCYTTNPGASCNVPMYNLPQTGIYTVRFDSPPQQNMSFNVAIVQAVSGTLTLNTPLTMSLPTSGQFAVVSFTLPTTQPVAFQFSSVSTNPASQYVNAALLNSSNSQVTSLNLNGGSQTTNLPSLAAGTYTIVVTPSYAATASFQLTMGSGISGTLPTDGTSIPISTNVPGQSAYYSFSGTAGQNIALVLSSMSLNPSTPATYIYPYVYKPDGSMLTDPNCYTTNPGASCNVPMYNLPQTGTYTVRFDSPPQQKMSFNVAIVQAVTATLVVGTPQNVSITAAGQFEVLSFTATAGQSSTLQLRSVTTTPTGQTVVATVYNPSGSQVTSLSSSGSTASVNLTNLVAGSYRIVVVPNYAATASAQVSLQ